MLLFFSEQVSVNEAKKGQFSTRSLLIFEMQFSPLLKSFKIKKSSESFNIVPFNETTALCLKSPIHHLPQERIGTEILQSSNSALDTLLEIKTTVTGATSL